MGEPFRFVVRTSEKYFTLVNNKSQNAPQWARSELQKYFWGDYWELNPD